MSNPKGSPKGATKTMLSMMETLKLADIVKANYTESNLDNAAYADFINTHHEGVFQKQITQSNVASVIAALGITGNRARTTKQDNGEENCTLLTARVAALEDQLSKLTNFINTKGYLK